MNKDKIKEILKEFDKEKDDDKIELLKKEYCLEEIKQIRAFLHTHCPNFKKYIKKNDEKCDGE